MFFYKNIYMQIKKYIRFCLMLSLLLSVMLFSRQVISAAESLGVASFTPTFLQLSDGLSGGYSLSGAAIISGAPRLQGGSYSLNPGVLDSIGAMPETLDDAHVWPNPCNAKKGCTGLTFAKLTYDAEIKIYTVSGELVWQAEKRDEFMTKVWDLTNTYGHKVASGLYVYYIKSGNSSMKGKFILIR